MTFAKEVKELSNYLEERSDKKDDFVGWLHLPTNYNKS